MILRHLRNRFARTSGVALVVLLAIPLATYAQQGVVVSGHLVDSVTTQPVANATVIVEVRACRRELMPMARSRSPRCLRGHHLLATAAGFAPIRKDIDVGTIPLTVEIRIDPELHYSEVVSVSPSARDQFELYQPTTVLAGQDLFKELNRRSAPRSARRRESPNGRSAPGRPGQSSRPRRRPRADSRGRPAYGGPLESIGRSRRKRESSGGLTHRSRARTGNITVRSQCDWWIGQRADE